MPPMGPHGKRHNGKKQKPKNTKAAVKRLFSYLEEDKAKIAAAFVCVIISAAANLGGSYMLRPIINGLTEDIPAAQKISGLLSGVIIMAVIYLCGVAATYFQSRIMIAVSQDTLQRIINEGSGALICILL